MKTLFNSDVAIMRIFILIIFTGFISCNGLQEPIGEDPELSVNAGSDQVVGLTEEVTLTGFASSSDGSSFSILWEIKESPAGSNLTLTEPTNSTIVFTPDILGPYVFRLTVSNDDISEFDEVSVSVEKLPIFLTGPLTEDLVLKNVYEEEEIPDYKISSSNYSVQAQLTIEAGVRIIFEEDGGMTVYPEGSLIAEGTADERIVMTGVQQTEGFWKGINFQSNDPDNLFDYVTIEYGGSIGFNGTSKKTNLMLENGGYLSMTNCISKLSGGHGLYVHHLETELGEFSQNVFTLNKNAPIKTSLNHYHFLDSGSDYTGNTNDYIDTEAGDKTSIDVTWQALNVPYRMAPSLFYIESDITIMPGAEFVGQEDSGILVYAGGSLNAVGSAQENIIFRGEEDIRGYWQGILFNSNTTKNELSFVHVKNGGQKGFYGTTQLSNIMLRDDGRLKMTNCESSKSAGYGLYIRHSGSKLIEFSSNAIFDNVAPVMTEISHYHYFDSESDFTGNDNDYIDSFTGSDVTGTVTWNKLTVPYRLASSLEHLKGDVTIEPGAEFLAQEDSAIQVDEQGSLYAVGTEQEIIVFKGEEDISGFWPGIKVQSLSNSNVISYASISNGGHPWFATTRKANVEVEGILEISNSTIFNSGGYGVRVRPDAIFSDIDNTYYGNEDGDVFYD